MKRLLDPREHAGTFLQLLRWTLLVVPVGILAGSASALFLWSLSYVTELRWQHGWLLFLLPVAGVVVGWIYLFVSPIFLRRTLPAEKGNPFADKV